MGEHKGLNEELPLLWDFYAQILKGVHNIGVAFSKWQPHWTKHIIHTVNEDLSKEFGGDEAKVMTFLLEKELIDKSPEGEPGERCYSVLVKTPKGYKVRCYAEVFKEEVNEAVKAIDELIVSLEDLDDEYKLQWILYFHTFKMALLETDRHKALGKWAEVDRVWMDIKSPVQVGHPLEYYEDKYRKPWRLSLM